MQNARCGPEECWEGKKKQLEGETAKLLRLESFFHSCCWLTATTKPGAGIKKQFVAYRADF